MSTRTEVRIHKNGKQVGCVYHHHDGYPSHIVNDLATIGNADNFKSVMKGMAKAHGTHNVKCSSGDKGKKYQGDIDYAYDVYMKKDRKVRGWSSPAEITKIKINEVKYDYKTNKFTQNKIYDGSVWDAYTKYVCKEGAK